MAPPPTRPHRAPRRSKASPGSARELARLVKEVGPLAAAAVDDLQVAASLEAHGVTDDLARDRYAVADVFVLAHQVRGRAGAPSPTRADRMGPRVAPTPDPYGWSRVAHGPLYLMPALALPAILGLVPGPPGVTALVAGGAVGWLWTTGSSWLGFHFLADGQAARAAAVILWLNLLGLCVGALVGVAILLVTGGSWVLVAMTVGLVGHQTATAALFFHGKRIWLYWCSWPAASGGLVFLVARQPEPVKRGAAAAAAASVVLLLVVSAVFGVRAARQPGDEPALPAPLRLRPRRLALGPWLPGAGWALLAAALSAAYLLTAQTVFLLDSLDVTAGLLGLFACMGLVEWRAAGFGFHVRELMTRVRYPHELRDGIPVLVLRDVGLCAAAAGVAGAVVGGALLAFGRLGAEGVLVVLATVPLSACYLNCFVLANLEEYPWLCGSLAVGLVLQLGLGAQPWLSWAAAFLVSSTVLLVVLLVGVVASPRPVRSFR